MNKASESEEILDLQNNSKSFKQTIKTQHLVRKPTGHNIIKGLTPIYDNKQLSKPVSKANRSDRLLKTQELSTPQPKQQSRCTKMKAELERREQEIKEYSKKQRHTFCLSISKQEKQKKEAEVRMQRPQENLLDASHNFEEAHYSQIAQFLGNYNLDLSQRNIEHQNENVFNLVKILNEQYKQFQEYKENDQ